ncbi:MAG: GHMP kinase [Pelosinus sp.]|nr:GHMP kinase [Pelosinus sp.]
MNVKVRAPGSCGELVQGTIDGQSFLITCPVDIYSQVEICTGAKPDQNNEDKLNAAVIQTLKYLKIVGYYAAKAESDLPIGKGMASSSADISACSQALALKFGKSLTADEIADIALAIEPTDGIFYPGIVMFDHIHGHLRQSLGQPPHMKILIFDVGGAVNTVVFNRRRDLASLNKNKEGEIRRAIALVTEGLKERNAKLIGQGATLSALANQAILYKPCLEKVVEIALQEGAVGVNIAHSGTVLGVLFTPDKEQIFAWCIERILKACPTLGFVRQANLIGGGLWKQEGDCDEWKISI